jgi:hypothetical protein
MEIKHFFKNFSKEQLKRNIKNLRNKFHFNNSQNLLKNLNIKKVAAINFSFMLFNYFLLKDKKIYNSQNDFDYLINFNIKDKEFLEKFKKKKVPKILYLKSFSETENEKSQIEGNFQKIHAKYKELDSYVFDIRKNLSSVYELQNLLKEYGHNLSDLFDENFKVELTNENLGKIKEELLKKPFLFLNKYGDVRNYKLEEFNEIAKSEAVYNYFEKLSILNNKNDLLVLNDYDYAFVIYLDSKNLDYNKQIFRIFRRMHFVVNFFNIKFFVATPEHSNFLSGMNLELNNAYLIKRDNLLGKNQDSVIKEFENENFEIVNLTKDLSNLKLNQDDSKLF